MMLTFVKSKHSRLKKQFTILSHTPDHVELRQGVWNPTSFTIKDDAKEGILATIIADLDGKLSLGELAKKHHITRSKLESIIDHLQSINALEDKSSSVLDTYLEQYSFLCRNAQSWNQPKQEMPVMLIGDDELTTPIYNNLTAYFDKQQIHKINKDDKLVTLLETSDTEWMHHGLKMEKILKQFSSWKGHFIVYVQKVVNPMTAAKLNRIAYSLEIPWIHSCVDGPFVLIGPTFDQHTACYDCFEKRLMINLREYSSYQRYKNALFNCKANIGSHVLEKINGGTFGVIHQHGNYQLCHVKLQFYSTSIIFNLPPYHGNEF